MYTNTFCFNDFSISIQTSPKNWFEDYHQKSYKSKWNLPCLFLYWCLQTIMIRFEKSWDSWDALVAVISFLLNFLVCLFCLHTTRKKLDLNVLWMDICWKSMVFYGSESIFTISEKLKFWSCLSSWKKTSKK